MCTFFSCMQIYTHVHTLGKSNVATGKPPIRENHRTKSWVFRKAIFDYLRVILPGAIRKTASIQDSGDFLHRQRVLSSRQRNQNLFGECHSYGPWLLVITGYFYWIIHPINDVLLVLITGISGQNCRDRFSSHWFGKSGRREIPAAA